MLVTLSGIVMDVRPEHLLKAQLPILVTLLPMIYSVTCSPKILFIFLLSVVLERIALEFIVIDVRPEQPKKAQAPMLVALFPIDTDVRPEQP